MSSGMDSMAVSLALGARHLLPVGTQCWAGDTKGVGASEVLGQVAAVLWRTT